MCSVDAEALVRTARHRAGLSQRELAARAGTSQSAIAAVESGRKQPSVATLNRWLEATGQRLSIEAADDEILRRRGEELVEVLRLAHALPFRRGQRLRFPRIPA
ncbi:MAG: putative Xre family DNA-binding protein [Frankiales bacterium]|nr:putative Xre family DNA-binding protein [Frankiales bacterium]